MFSPSFHQSQVSRWIRPAVVAALVIATLLLGSASASAAVSCSLYASPSGSGSGSLSSPFGSAQALVDALQPGQTGCLMGGTYDLSGSGGELKFNRGGSSGAPVTLASAPGGTATLVGGIVYVPNGSDYVTITDVHINTHGATQPGVQVMGANDALTRSDVTNLNSKYSCVILGSDQGWGQAVNTLLEGNVIHECGNTAPNQDHGVYVDNVVGATITNNIFWGIPDGWGVHVYPHAQNTQVTHNVIDGNGGGVIFGGNTASTSNNNVAAYNVITNSTHFYGVESWWGGTVGTGNIAKNNCVAHDAGGNIETPEVGFTAQNNLVANQTYMDAATHNYMLKPGSPCLGVVGYDTAAMLAGHGVHATMASRRAACRSNRLAGRHRARRHHLRSCVARHAGGGSRRSRHHR
jgi:Right handed beta helix region